MDNLITYANTYEQFYKQNAQSIFHVASGCVAGQQVSFAIGKSIRKELYKLCNDPITNQLSRKLILETDLTQIKNLSLNRIELLKKMAKINDQQEIAQILQDYSKLKGFGSWTFNAVSILMGIDNCVNLSTDAYIRKNISLYVGLKMTEKECHEYISTAGLDQTKVCYLLWRIKPQSIHKLKKQSVLNKGDFV